MIKILLFILIPILIVAGLGYWRFVASQQSLTTPKISTEAQDSGPVEVPKTLPKTAPLASPQKTSVPNVSDSRIANLEAMITELKARVSVLEQATPAPVAASSGAKYPLYIPMGSGGGPWTDQDWNTLAEYQVAVNPDNYTGYSGMQLEVNFRLSEAAGTGSVRLYNSTDGSSISSPIDTTSTSFGTQSSGTFKLPSGQKTYTIQVKSTQGKSLFIQSARIKVTF